MHKHRPPRKDTPPTCRTWRAGVPASVAGPTGARCRRGPRCDSTRRQWRHGRTIRQGTPRRCRRGRRCPGRAHRRRGGGGRGPNRGAASALSMVVVAGRSVQVIPSLGGGAVYRLVAYIGCLQHLASFLGFRRRDPPSNPLLSGRIEPNCPTNHGFSGVSKLVHTFLSEAC